jgi:hypothetical protein
MQSFAHPLRRDKAATPVGHLIEEGAEHPGTAYVLDIGDICTFLALFQGRQRFR